MSTTERVAGRAPQQLLRLTAALVIVLVASACEATARPDAGIAPSNGPVATVQPPTAAPPVARGDTAPPPTTEPTPTTTNLPTTTTAPVDDLTPHTDGSPATRIISPIEGGSATTPTVITGQAAGIGRIGRLTITVKDTGTGTYWNPSTGEWQDEWLWYDAPLASTSTPVTTWTFDFDPAGTEPSGLFQVTAFAWDGSGTKDPTGDRIRFSATEDTGDLELVWSDEFDGNSLDLTKWKTFTGEYGTPYRDQHYTERPQNVRVEQGNLVLEAHDEPMGDQNFTSGMVVSNDLNQPGVGASRGNLAWTHGRFEVRARVPDVSGLWPAFWMRPRDAAYGSWPRSGEIDILEYFGPTPNGSSTAGRYFVGALHTWDPDGGGGTGGGTGGSKKHEGVHRVDGDFVDDFHTFAVEWEAERFRWYVDGRLFHVADRDWQAPGTAFPAPFDQPFFLTLNLQVGGYAGPVDTDALPADASFEIDYVRVYQ